MKYLLAVVVLALVAVVGRAADAPYVLAAPRPTAAAPGCAANCPAGRAAPSRTVVVVTSPARPAVVNVAAVSHVRSNTRTHLFGGAFRERTVEHHRFSFRGCR